MPEITRKVVLSPNPARLYRNPVYLADESRKRMQIKGISQADLARELGVSRARVMQMMNILKLPKSRLDDLRALGDPMSGPTQSGHRRYCRAVGCWRKRS